MSASITRQHFTAIAETLRIELKFAQGPEERSAIIRVAGALAVDFKQFNIHFDRERFMAAVLAGNTSDRTETHAAESERLNLAAAERARDENEGAGGMYNVNDAASQD